MHYHLILTELCNSKCKYCYERSLWDFDNPATKRFSFENAPERTQIDMQRLKKFLENDLNPTLIFYGGEPLLEIEKIKETMDAIDVPYRIQTNGKLLNKLPKQYVNRIGKILVSLDGTKERTDSNRGAGTYDLVVNNVKQLMQNGYAGELIARMAIDFPDVCEQVKALVAVGFTSIHWQLTLGFYRCDWNKEKIISFVKNYNKSLSLLIDFWLDELKKGKVLRFYPFVAIVDSLLKQEPTKMRCGAGHSGYTITTSGNLSACPILNNIEDFYAGDLSNKTSELKRFETIGRCLNCEIKPVCGGRCLYWNYAKVWPEEGDILICKTIKHLVTELQRILPDVKELLKKEIISARAFDYEKYFGPEIIP